MRSRRKVQLVTSMVLLLACTIALATQPPTHAVSTDYRIDVETGRIKFNDNDILTINVKLFNNDAIGVKINPRNPNMPDDPNAPEPNVIFESFNNDTPTDVQIVPKKFPKVIGYANLRYIGPRPIISDTNFAPPQKNFRLPLFGRTFVPAHSTKIISHAKVLLWKPSPKCPDDVEDEFETDNPEDVERLEAVALYRSLKPGYYLLTCNIDTLAGTKLAQAQKMIKIAPRRHHLNTKLNIHIKNQIKNISTKIDDVEKHQKKIGLYDRLNNLYLRYLLMRQ